MSATPFKPEEAVADAAARARALDVTTSFVVQAPAGSGKTGLLVLRFLALLARVDRPEAVLAITFTRKAAGEMRRRIVEALAEAAASARSPDNDFDRQRHERARAVLERDAELGWGLLHSPSRLQVFTIDSFCSRVVAGTPLLSRLGATPSVVTETRPLYLEAVRRTLAPAGRARLAEHFETLLERYEMGVDRLQDQLVDMLGRREQWRAGASQNRHDEAASVAGVEAAFRKAIEAEVGAVAAGAEPGIVAAIHELAVASRGVVGGEDCKWPTLGETDFLGAGAEAAAAWKQASALLLRPTSPDLRTDRSRNADLHGGDAAVKKRLSELLAALGDLPEGAMDAWTTRLRLASKLPARATFGREGREALGAFLAVLRQALGELFTIFRERREVDHSEIAMGAVAALEPGETLEKLDARIDHILVDEFQDTNVLQCDLLKGLTSGWMPGDGRTLFLVGDPMQSIYRFRKAEVGLFLAARASAAFLENVPRESLRLSVNFRSTATLVAWVGRTFSALLGDRDDAVRSLVAFAPAAPRPGAGEGPEVEFLSWTTAEGAEPVQADTAEADGLADWIAAEVATIRASQSEKRSFGSAPVAVLVRARRHAQPLLRALEARSPALRVRAPGLDMLADRATVVDLEALVRALLHPGDRLSWLALLRSRWVGLSLGDLAALVEPDVAGAGSGSRPTPVPLLIRDKAALARVSEDAAGRLARLVPILDAARRELASRSLDVVVRSAWLRLGGPASGPETTRVDALDAEAFFDLLGERSRAGSLDLDDFARSLAETEAPVDSDAEVDVDIMTMHKAKGLEFDTVVLPALGRSGGRGSSPPLAMETEPDTGRLTLLAPRAARGRSDEDGDKYGFLQMREKRREESETLRLLYVATTRARRRLLLSAAAGRFVEKGARASAGSLLAAMASVLPVDAARQVEAPPPVASPPRASLRFPRERQLAALPASVADRSLRIVSPSERQDAAELLAVDRGAARVGIVYHAFAERISREGLEAWPPSRPKRERAGIEHALRSEGMAPPDLAAGVERVLAAVEATLADERGRWILTAHDEARSEWAVTGWDGAGMTSAQIDRTFVDGGVRWVVDFKTAAWTPGDDDEDEYVAAKCAGYAGQLSRYRALLLTREPATPVRVALYFPEWPEERRWQDVTVLADAEAAGRI
jgi:ATP-dependent helicase/nuclease subunit A